MRLRNLPNCQPMRSGFLSICLLCRVLFGLRLLLGRGSASGEISGEGLLVNCARLAFFINAPRAVPLVALLAVFMSFPGE